MLQQRNDADRKRSALTSALKLVPVRKTKYSKRETIANALVKVSELIDQGQTWSAAIRRTTKSGAIRDALKSLGAEACHSLSYKRT